MGLIKKSAELDIPQNVKMIVYGQAGMGKTTFALSAPKPLLLDFDGGVKRVNLSHLDGVDIVQVTKWEEVKEVLQENLYAYQTIVVDTIGKMMDFIIAYKCGMRQPQIREWSGINQEFQWFTRAVSMLNKNVVFVAHRDTRKEGDDNVFIPALREKNYNSIVTDVDLLGYMEMRSENGRISRTITFDPTTRNDGKNTCNLPSIMTIPSLIDSKGNAIGNNDFVTSKIIAPYVAMLQSKQVERAEYDKVIAEIQQDIDGLTDAESTNKFIAKLKTMKHVGNSLQYARNAFNERLQDLSIYYDEKKKQYADSEL